MKHYTNGSLKLVVGWVVVFLTRFLPHPPNVEPIMTTLMPFSKRYGAVGGFLFAASSIALYDVAVGKVGMWTAVTALVYGTVGLGAYFFLRNRKNNATSYGLYAIIGTLIFDGITLFIGPVFYHQPLMEALVGQIPFTAYHLVGNIAFSLLLSPLLYRWVVANESLELPSVLARFRAHPAH